MAGQVVKVKSEILQACMTCPLCKKLLRDATTISLCLHTCMFLFPSLEFCPFLFPMILIWRCLVRKLRLTIWVVRAL